MKIDLRKLYTQKEILLLEELIIIPEAYYQNMDIIKIKPVNVDGRIFINNDNEIEFTGNIKGEFIMPCAVSLEPVEVPFTIELATLINEKARKNQINLDLLDILWENMVLEVPIKAIKKDVKANNVKGEGWELEQL